MSILDCPPARLRWLSTRLIQRASNYRNPEKAKTKSNPSCKSTRKAYYQPYLGSILSLATLMPFPISAHSQPAYTLHSFKLPSSDHITLLSNQQSYLEHVFNLISLCRCILDGLQHLKFNAFFPGLRGCSIPDYTRGMQTWTSQAPPENVALRPPRMLMRNWHQAWRLQM